MKLLIINGPNLNMLGIREPEIYGTKTYDDLVSYIRKERGENNELSFVQSNHEGDLIDAIQQAYYDRFDGIVINAGGYAHTSISIMDAIRGTKIPTVEVHITEPLLREDYRHHSYAGEAAIATIAGKGFDGYVEAIDLLHEHIALHS
ncbi:MAG: 3-dehydroquinate dehydratase [Mogibacterium sp.]|nr:3-dehydroquinate dehydratase [Mogibacterium sp.]MBR2540012.1 3-dehydroquinate dehydratase [Mogibacterium sp.]